MKILAIDASSKSTGIAIFQDNQLMYYECISIQIDDTYARIIKMRDRILEIYNKYQPTDIVMQEILPQDVRHNQLVFKTLIYLQSAIILGLYQNFHVKNVQLVVASHWRSLCGIRTGRGIKRDTLKKASINLIKKKYGIEVNDDVSDAICIGLAYLEQHASAF